MVSPSRQQVFQFSKQVIMFSFGQLFLALGVTISIKSNLGVSPINSVPFIVSQITQIDMGQIVTAYFCCLLLLQIILLRKEFKLFNLLQLVFSSLFGYFVTASNALLSGIEVQTNFIVQLFFLAVSIVLVAIGLLLYLTADIVPMPPEGTVRAISVKTGIDFSKLKVVFDCTAVGVSIALSLTFFHTLNGIGIGTILSAIFIGKMLGVISAWWKPSIQKLILMPA